MSGRLCYQRMTLFVLEKDDKVERRETVRNVAAFCKNTGKERLTSVPDVRGAIYEVQLEQSTASGEFY